MPPALAAAIRATARGLGVWLGKYCTIFLGARVEELPPDARCQGRAREPAVPVGHRIERPGIWLAVANYRTVWRAFYSLGALALIWYRSIVGGKRLARDLDALFDADYYRESNPDVAASRWPPRVHYLLFGGPEGRNPHPLFDVSYYLSRYPDVRKSRINPLFHYVLFGAAEGRSTYPSFAAGAYGGAISDAARLTPGRSPSAGPARTAIAWRKKRDESGTLWKWFRAVYDTTRGATVAAEVLDQARGPKIIAFKKRRRKNSRRKRGHRQEFTLLRITEILTEGKEPSKTAPPRPKRVRPVAAAAQSEAAAPAGEN